MKESSMLACEGYVYFCMDRVSTTFFVRKRFRYSSEIMFVIYCVLHFCSRMCLVLCSGNCFQCKDFLHVNEMFVSVCVVTEMMQIKRTTFWCAVHLYQNVENSVKVNYSLFIYSTYQTHGSIYSLQTKPSHNICR